MSQFFASDGQSIGALTSASVLPMNIQDWFPLELTGWISLLSKGLSRVFSKHHSSKALILWCSASPIVQLSHPYVITGKTVALTRWAFVGKVMSLFFNMLSRLVVAFLPVSKRLLISWLQSPSAVIMEPKKIKSVTVYIVSPYICHEVMGPDAMVSLISLFNKHQWIIPDLKPAGPPYQIGSIKLNDLDSHFSVDLSVKIITWTFLTCSLSVFSESQERICLSFSFSFLHF